MEVTFAVVLFRLCVQFLALPIYLLWYVGIWEPLCKRTFPFFMCHFSNEYNKSMSAQKKKLFSNLKDFADSKGQLRLLEVGTGSGSNFQFYPAGCRMICTDPNPHFKKFLNKNLSENTHLHLQQCLVAQGENLHQIPDASVDVVVCTLVMCSVESIDGVLKEVLRVLRPGGAFFFMEHVAGSPSTWSLFWQQIYDPTWEIIFDGCHLTRETWKNLEKAGFSELHLQHICAPLKWNPAQPHIIGYAVK